jgi:hypothetical protein
MLYVIFSRFIGVHLLVTVLIGRYLYAVECYWIHFLHMRHYVFDTHTHTHTHTVVRFVCNVHVFNQCSAEKLNISM